MNSTRLAILFALGAMIFSLRTAGDFRFVLHLCPWILAATLGWSLLLTWLLRRAQEILLKRPGSRLAESVRDTDSTTSVESKHAA